MGMLALALVFSFSAPQAHAAVDRAVVDYTTAGNPGQAYVYAHYMDGGTEAQYYGTVFSVAGLYTTQDFVTAAEASIQSYATGQGYSLPNGVVWPYLSPTQIQALIAGSSGSHVPSNLSLSIQTSTGAVGTQVSTTTGMWVSIAGQVSTTANIAGSSAGDIIVEVAPTNSATAGDWVEWGRIGNSQALSLAVALQSVQIVKGQVLAWVPQGYYVKARSSGSGTVSYQLNTVKKLAF